VVPDDYAEFFVATATVAGALIGLLFVAISVRPAAAARTAHITTRLRSIAALSAFLNTLFLSLLALRPRADIGNACVALGAAGLVAMVVLLVLLVAQGRDRLRPMLRGVVLVAGQGVLYAAQLWDGRDLVLVPGDVSRVDDLAVIVLILFALGLARAWEFVGADNPTLLAALGRTVAPRSGDEPADDTRPPGRPD
jgi:hypothetical protein